MWLRGTGSGQRMASGDACPVPGQKGGVRGGAAPDAQAPGMTASLGLCSLARRWITGAALWGFQSRTRRQGTSQLTTHLSPSDPAHTPPAGSGGVSLSQRAPGGPALCLALAADWLRSVREPVPAAPPPTPHKGSATTGLLPPPSGRPPGSRAPARAQLDPRFISLPIPK